MYYLVEEDPLREHTVSRKSERLVNLTIALLGTKRWLTKTEIFQSIDGYEGEADAKERMFERDKDDLRKLGITIEVGSFDPLFDDEVGYRIRPESYSTNLTSLTSREFSLISLATKAWQGAILDSTALSALLKLKSLGIESDFDSLPAIGPHMRNSDSNLPPVIDAISQRIVISFSYINADDNSEVRTLEPYGVGTKDGYWYVAGKDLNRREIRLFRFDRFDSDITFQGKSGSFSAPDEFSMKSLLDNPEKVKSATVRVRRGKALALRKKALSTTPLDDWDDLEIAYIDEALFIHDVLWHGSDAVIISPENVRCKAKDALTEIVGLHG
jgi:proteasome accessory factor B